MNLLLMLPCLFLRRWAACALLLLASAGVAALPVQGSPVPLLWAVRTAGVQGTADTTVYLLGSFHLLRTNDYPLATEVQRALQQAALVVFEVAPQDMADAQAGALMAQAALRADGTALDNALPPQIAKQLRLWSLANSQWMDALQITPQQLQSFNPWFVATLVTLVELQKAGLEPDFGLDVQLMEHVRQADKPTTGLETAREQIRFLSGMDADEQVQFLQQALEQAAAGSAQIDLLHALWRAGDAEGLQRALVVEFAQQFPRLHQRLNVQRNAAWLPQIEAWLQQPPQQTVLVVVGAMHLVGADGLVERLRARGYAIERICSTCAQDD